ncbi:MAG: amidohydrolase family protein [Candidatus Omnitrophica bacterium]|nr:amidohydrolase family protein [Candidatus Omnitrophota bacterium]
MTWENLIARLDDEGIDKAVFLPVYNATSEMTPLGFFESERQGLREQVIDAAKLSDRIIPFGNIDPRWGYNSEKTDFGDILDWFQEHGCKGFGEICANIPFDDPRTINLFRQVGERGMPITIESCNSGWGLGFQDDPGSPRLEYLLKAAPKTIIIGHGPAFWAEIGPVHSAKEKGAYPTGHITKEGPLARLLREYPNLYADISAFSGFNALSRDLNYTVKFLNEFQDRILFGTDIIARDISKREKEQEQVNELLDEVFKNGFLAEKSRHKIQWCEALMPQLDFLKRLVKEGFITQEVYHKITYSNATRLLGI